MSDATRSRPLAILRAMIDAIDRDTLQLFARRMALVSEVAGFKREHRVRIRDLNREREVLGDRTGRAAELGLPTGVVESIYRLLLLASRDYQASLRAEVPLDVEPKSVAIIGGRGGMGSVMDRLFSDLGHHVMIVDVDTSLTAAEAASIADVVVISVPIDITEQVIREVGPKVRPDALLMDVTSIKTRALAAMLESTEASVVGTHPMFGPGVHSLTGQRVVVCEGRGNEWLEWVKETFHSRGMVITEASAEEHDRVMGVVQVLNHFHTQVLGLTLARLGVDVHRTLDFTSPVYLLEMYVTARHFGQSPELYGPIEMNNPRLAEVTEAFEGAAHELAEILTTQDQPRFRQVYRDVRSTFGDFTEEAVEQSRFLIDRLVELTSGRPSSAG